MCLGYSDQVCDGIRGKCVDKEGICFEQYACGFGTTTKSFVCRKDAEQLVDECAEKFEAVKQKHNNAVRCVIAATTLEDAQLCVSRR